MWLLKTMKPPNLMLTEDSVFRIIACCHIQHCVKSLSLTSHSDSNNEANSKLDVNLSFCTTLVLSQIEMEN